MNEQQKMQRELRADRKATEKGTYHGRMVELPDDLDHRGPALKRLAKRRKRGIPQGAHTYYHVTKGFRVRQTVVVDHLAWRLRLLRAGQGFGPSGAL